MMKNSATVDSFFEMLAEVTPSEEVHAPSRLKASIYSRLMQAESAAGPLASLRECREGGRELCRWEELIQIAPLGGDLKRLNHCRFCHARVLGERLEGAPLYWKGCPYAAFQS